MNNIQLQRGNAAMVRAGEVQRQIALCHLSQKTHDIGNASYATHNLFVAVHIA